MLQQFLGQQKSMHGHGSKQELKKINVVAFINWDPQKIPNLRTRFSMGGDGGGFIGQRLSQMAENAKLALFK